MSEFEAAQLRRLVSESEARLRDDLHDSLSTMQGVLLGIVEARVGELEQRLEAVHREALKVLTDYYSKGER